MPADEAIIQLVQAEPGAGSLRTAGSGVSAPRVRARLQHPARPRRRRGPGPGGVREALAGAAALRRPRAALDLDLCDHAQRRGVGAARAPALGLDVRRRGAGGSRGHRARRQPRSPRTAHLRRQVDALPEKQRQAITLYYLDERPVDEVAEMMGMPVNTVKTHLHRARASLAAALGSGRRRSHERRTTDLDARMRRHSRMPDTAAGFEARVAARIAALRGCRRPRNARAPNAGASSCGGSLRARRG